MFGKFGKVKRSFRRRGNRYTRYFKRKYNNFGNPRFSGFKRTELKCYDENDNLKRPDIGGTVYWSPLGQIATGSQINNRVGNRLIVRSISGRWTITAAPSALATTGYSHVRVLLVIDKQCNTENMSSGVEPLMVGFPINAPLNTEKLTKYSILMDQKIVLDNNHPSHELVFYKKLKMSVAYATEAAALPMTNNIFFILLSNETVGSADRPYVIDATRIRYIDN